MTDQEIEEKSKVIADYNDKVASDSLTEFAKADMSEKVWEVGYLTEEIGERLHAVRTGKAPAQFGQFVEDMLARALSTEMFCRADGLYLDVKRSKASPDAKPVIRDCPLGWFYAKKDWGGRCSGFAVKGFRATSGRRRALRGAVCGGSCHEGGRVRVCGGQADVQPDYALEECRRLPRGDIPVRQRTQGQRILEDQEPRRTAHAPPHGPPQRMPSGR